jgi:ABC-type transport system involved in multi-copper enzyme maturation permease subunit
MISRIVTIALSTYREAVRARVLLSVFAIGLATCAYSLVVGTLSLHNDARVVADIGAASVSLYGVLIAIVLGSTSLQRELEHRTVFPILSRPIRRWEYLVGKYLGIVMTVAVFVCVQSSAALLLLAAEAGRPAAYLGAAVLAWVSLNLAAGARFRRARAVVFAACAPLGALAAWVVAAPAFEERQLVAASALLALGEVAIVTGVATLFSSFSSPFLTAACTAMVFVIGRSADTLEHLPPRLFGPAVGVGRVVGRIVPNLHIYVPARTLLLGRAQGHPVWPYVTNALLCAVAYSVVLLVLSSIAFRRRDFS